MLTIKKLNKTYTNGIKALSDVSLEIPYGIFGLLGPNGAGKSTLMRTLATLQIADSGVVRLDEMDLFENPQESRKQLGFLPQDFGVYPNVSAEEMLEQIAVFKGFTHPAVRKEMVKHQLDLVNLYQKRKQKLGTFSGGMRQRFGIAQAMLGSPKLMIVDEPTAGLDPTERIRFHNLLAAISEDRTLILSTHIVEDVTDLCLNMAIMSCGKVVRKGKPLELIESLKGKVWTKEVDFKSMEKWKVGYPTLIQKMNQGKPWVRIIRDEAPEDDFEQTEGNLEDVYNEALLGNNYSSQPDESDALSIA
ncbi:MAG: ABC transporter ATP-binding protein [Verrucomicrobiota bacterium]